jgi:hypothetical protein
MIAAAYLLLALGWLGLYAGFTDTDPRSEIVAAIGSGRHAQRGSVAASPKPPSKADITKAHHATHTVGVRI